MDCWENISESDKIRITVADGAFEGIIHTVDVDSRMIVLAKVVSVASAKRFSTLMCFYSHEIEHVELVEKSKPKERVINPRLEIKRVLAPAENGPEKLTKNLPEKNHINCDVTGIQDTSLSEESDSGYGETTTKVGGKQVPSCIINKLNAAFYDAVGFIKTKSMIGVNVEGIDIGRFGKLCWLQIRTREQVFLFDMLSLGRDFFEEGLKDIMESRTILKIIHDCRSMSDMFHHQYILKLVNVFDTQVADVLVQKLNQGFLPRHVKSLPDCVIDRLHLSSNDVYFSYSSTLYRQADHAIWKQRPLPAHLRDAAVKDVVHLLELHTALMDLLLSELVYGVDAYLDDHRLAPDEELVLLRPHVLPKSFQDLVDNANRRRARNAFVLRRPGFHSNGVIDNRISPSDPEIKFQKNIWHSNIENERGIQPLHATEHNARRSLDSNVSNTRPKANSNRRCSDGTVRNKEQLTKMMPNSQNDEKKKLLGAMPAGMMMPSMPKGHSPTDNFARYPVITAQTSKHSVKNSSARSRPQQGYSSGSLSDGETSGGCAEDDACSSDVLK